QHVGLPRDGRYNDLVDRRHVHDRVQSRAASVVRPRGRIPKLLHRVREVGRGAVNASILGCPCSSKPCVFAPPQLTMRKTFTKSEPKAPKATTVSVIENPPSTSFRTKLL